MPSSRLARGTTLRIQRLKTSSKELFKCGRGHPRASSRRLAIEVWWQDEARDGQKNKTTGRCARHGTRPWRSTSAHRMRLYLYCGTPAMQVHLHSVIALVAPGTRTILILEQAG